MKRLLLMRHAKSSWNSHAASDHKRPLNSRGRRDAPKIATHLREKNWIPQLTLSSDSTRTRQTWEHMKPVFGTEIAVQFSNDLYLAGLGEIRRAILSLATSQDCILVLGHNPGWEEAASSLAKVDIDMTTANVVALSSEASDWKEALVGEWQLHFHLRPKECP